MFEIKISPNFFKKQFDEYTACMDAVHTMQGASAEEAYSQVQLTLQKLNMVFECTALLPADQVPEVEDTRKLVQNRFQHDSETLKQLLSKYEIKILRTIESDFEDECTRLESSYDPEHVSVFDQNFMNLHDKIEKLSFPTLSQEGAESLRQQFRSKAFSIYDRVNHQERASVKPAQAVAVPPLSDAEAYLLAELSGLEYFLNQREKEIEWEPGTRIALPTAQYQQIVWDLMSYRREAGKLSVFASKELKQKCHDFAVRCTEMIGCLKPAELNMINMTQFMIGLEVVANKYDEFMQLTQYNPQSLSQIYLPQQKFDEVKEELKDLIKMGEDKLFPFAHSYTGIEPSVKNGLEKVINRLKAIDGLLAPEAVMAPKRPSVQQVPNRIADECEMLQVQLDSFRDHLSEIKGFAPADISTLKELKTTVERLLQETSDYERSQLHGQLLGMRRVILEIEKQNDGGS